MVISPDKFSKHAFHSQTKIFHTLGVIWLLLSAIISVSNHTSLRSTFTSKSKTHTYSRQIRAWHRQNSAGKSCCRIQRQKKNRWVLPVSNSDLPTEYRYIQQSLSWYAWVLYFLFVFVLVMFATIWLDWNNWRMSRDVNQLQSNLFINTISESIAILFIHFISNSSIVT